MKPDRDTLDQIYTVDGLSTRAIADRFGVSHMSVKRWLRKYAIASRPAGRGLQNRGIIEPTRDELFDMVHVQYLSYRKIAATYGVDFTAIPYWLRKHGIDLPLVWNTRRKGNNPVLPTQNELNDLYATGLSIVEIGALYGVSDAPIRRLCGEYGIAVRRDGWDGGKRFTCIDGHLVRSTYEQRVDNWLSSHQIEHSYEPVLPPDPRSHADFLANGWYIEVWGVTDSLEYDERRRRKTALYHAHHLPLIELPRHAFDKRHNDLWCRRLLPCLTPATANERPNLGSNLLLNVD